MMSNARAGDPGAAPGPRLHGLRGPLGGAARPPRAHRGVPPRNRRAHPGGAARKRGRPPVHPPGRRLRRRACRAQRGGGHPHRLGQNPGLQPAHPPDHAGGPRGQSHVPVSHQGAFPGPAVGVERGAVGRRAAGEDLHLRRGHPAVHPHFGARGGAGGDHQPRHAAHRDPAQPPQVDQVLSIPALRGGGRDPHLPGGVRLAHDQPGAAPEAGSRLLRGQAPVHLLLSHHRQPARAHRADPGRAGGAHR